MNLEGLVSRLASAPDERWDICSQLYTALVSSDAQPIDLAPFASSFAAFWRDVDEQVRPFQEHSGNSWRWAEEYQDPRNEAILLLDILGHVPGEEIVGELQGALTLRDPRLMLFAAASLFRQGQAVSGDVIQTIASFDETRSALENTLQELGFPDLFPMGFTDGESRARAQFVDWLTDPMEWECSPDDLELMDIVYGDTYVFQFRTRPGFHWSSRYGWVAGIAGLQAASDYMPAEAADAESHARRILHQPGRVH